VQLRTGLRLLFFERGNASTTENGPRLGRVREPSRSAFELAGAFVRFGIGGTPWQDGYAAAGLAGSPQPRSVTEGVVERSAFELAGALGRFGFRERCCRDGYAAAGLADSPQPRSVTEMAGRAGLAASTRSAAGRTTEGHSELAVALLWHAIASRVAFVESNSISVWEKFSLRD
jgi:hypothetical protein